MKTTAGKCCVAVVLVVGFICAGQGLAETYYVSLNGSDTANDGLTEATAFRTISHAAGAAWAGDTVMVKGGNYGDERISPHSGTSVNPIVFQGYDGRPTLSSTDGYAKAFDLSYRSHISIKDFDFHGYEFAVYARGWSVNGSTHFNLQNLRSFGRGGAIHMKDGVCNTRVESCYIEDSYRNSICFHGDSLWNDPCDFNTVANCAVVRGGHSSIDIHTNCLDTYVAGNLIRERGYERNGSLACAGFYLHNHDIDRIRVIGNSVSDVVWGLELAGADYGIVAENLIYNCEKVDVDSTHFPEEGTPLARCTENTIKDNIIFNAGTSSMRLCGAEDNKILRNHIEGALGYDSYQYNGVDPTGNSITDPMRGAANITVRHGGTYALSFSEGIWPTGTVFNLTGSSTATKTMGPGGVSFGVLTAGTYNVRATLPGTLPAPQHLRVMPLPEVDGGAVIVWTDGSNNETGFVVERKLTGGEFIAITTLPAGATRYIDAGVGRSKAVYRVRAIQGAGSSEWSNTDEVVRYGYWFTDRTGLTMAGVSNESSAFGQVEDGVLKTLVVEQVTRVERHADAVEGVSSLALLEVCVPVISDWPDSFGSTGETEVWLDASESVTATLRWRDGWIRGFVECDGVYDLDLHAAGWADGSVMFNYEVIDAVYDADSGLLSITLDGSGELAIELVPEPATMVLLLSGGVLAMFRRREGSKAKSMGKK
ncbi:MAG: PEP-CTERM sorting domain-containing protein [Phycisphaerae bacterium]|nr:PEP-CTERM sorting domain-containing protein [Phycisphaerae bacterium]